MKIKITGRHINVSENLKDHAEKKISKLEKYFQQLIDTHLIFYKEKLDHVAEVIIHGDAVQFHAREKSSDFYSAIDLLVDKLESQVARYKDKIQSRKGAGVEMAIPFDITSEKGKEALMNQVSNKPIDKIEAYLQMKVDNSDFILFKKGVSEIDSDIDYLNKNYAVIFKEGEQVKLCEVPFEKNSGFESGVFHEYELDVMDETMSNPKIDFNKKDNVSVKTFTLDEAIDSIDSAGKTFLPFYNVETGYFNVITKSGDNYEVLVPAF